MSCTRGGSSTRGDTPFSFSGGGGGSANNSLAKELRSNPLGNAEVRGSSRGGPTRTKPEVAVPMADALIFICRPTSSSSSRRIPATAAVICTSNGQSLASVPVFGRISAPHTTLSEMCSRSWCADAALVKTRLTTSQTIRLAFLRAETSDEATES